MDDATNEAAGREVSTEIPASYEQTDELEDREADRPDAAQPEAMPADVPSRLGRFWVHVPQKAVLSGALIVLLLPQILGDDILPSMILAGLLGLAGVGLGLLAGRAGLVSLGQAALMAVGGYGAAYAAVRWDWPAEAALLFGIFAGLVVAWVTSPICRLKGFYLATATLTLALIVQRLLVAFISLTGGSNGFTGIPPLTLFGYEFNSEFRFYVLVWGVALLGVALNDNLLRGRFGRGLDIVHGDEATASAVGVNVGRYKSAAWMISSGYAALAGGLYAYYNRFLSPDQFPLPMSIDLIAGVVVGGAAAALGPLVGMVALVVIPTRLDLGPSVSAMIAPALLVLSAALLPRGIVPHVRDLSDSLVRRMRG